MVQVCLATKCTRSRNFEIFQKSAQNSGPIWKAPERLDPRLLYCNSIVTDTQDKMYLIFLGSHHEDRKKRRKKNPPRSLMSESGLRPFLPNYLAGFSHGPGSKLSDFYVVGPGR